MPMWDMVTSRLFALDVAVFRLVNHYMANELFDVVMPFITDIAHWRLIIVGIALFLVTFGGRRGRWLLAAIVVTVALTDGVIGHSLKHWLDKPRPFLVLDGVRVLIGAGGGSFPSAHAANMFALATVFSAWVPRLGLLGFGFASLIAFSRVYVGVHYPSDVIGGGMLGILAGLFVLWMVRNWGGCKGVISSGSGGKGGSEPPSAGGEEDSP